MKSNEMPTFEFGRKGPVGIQSRLVVLLLVVLIPILGVQALIHYDRFQTRRAEELQANLEVARAVGRSFETFVGDVLHQELSIGLALASSQALTEEDRNRILNGSKAGNPAIWELFWARTDGVVIAATGPQFVGMSLEDRPYFQEILSGRDWVVSDLLLSRTTKRPSFTIARGIRNGTGQLLGVMVAGVAPEKLDGVLAFDRPGDAGVSLLDSKGMHVYGHPAMEYTWEQRNWLTLYPVIGEVLKGKDVVTTIVSNLTGTERFVGFTPVPAVGWVSAASRAADEAMESVASAILWHGAMFLGVALASVLLALWMSRTIARPMEKIHNHVLSLGRGSWDVGVEATGPREIQALANALNWMSMERKQMEDALRQSEQNLKIELDAARRLQQVSTQLIQAEDIQALYEQILDTAVAVLHADFASIQMLYTDLEPGAEGELRLLGHRGFNAQAVKYWEWVSPASQSSCGVALRIRERVITPDVERCDFMTGSDDMEMYLQNGIRAVQTTPLVSRSGKLLGMLSTHWREPHEPTAGELRAFDVLARQAADLIGHKKAEEALRRREEELRALVENAPDVISLFDRNLRRIYVNSEVRENTGQDASFMKGKSLTEAGYPDSFTQPLNTALQNVFATGSEETVELGWEAPKGCLWLLIRCAPLRTADGSVERVMSIGRDITERKRMEEELQKSHNELELRVEERTAELALINRALREYSAKLERLNKELEEFSWIATHDLQEPLRKIQSFGSRLERMRDSLSKEGQADLLRMIQSANRMASLIKALKSYSEATREMGSFEPTNLSRVVKDAVSDLELAIQEAGGRVEMGELPSVEVDREGVRRVFQNLIGNSMKYAKEDEKPVVRITGEVENGMCRIQVEDNGIGFDETYREKIFTPFQRLHGRNSPYEGTGMGLAVCRKVVEMHGGAITAGSTPGCGATFIISLPVKQRKGVGQSVGA